MSSPIIIACLKWVAHPGEPHDERFAGASPADRAALELALQQAKELGGTVTAVTVGPPATETVLRDAVAAGADRAVRVDGPAAMLSSDVAAGIAGVAEGAAWVWCGDYSLDRGTGSVPAFLAAALGAQQALGVIDVQFAAPGPAARVTRRLDGGRREVLDVTGPAVVSVEGAVADLRRAGLGALRVATSASIDVVPLHVHAGDVDYRSGNLHTKGALVVQGDVGDGFAVTAGGDLVIAGTLQGSKARAGGRIEVERGIVGATASARSGSDIRCHHATAARLVAENTIEITDQLQQLRQRQQP